MVERCAGRPLDAMVSFVLPKNYGESFWINLTLECRISRDNTSLNSNVHFFTSHFYSSFLRGQRVASWTNNINIFEKRLVIIPINHSNHWSLCVIANPGATVKDRFPGRECRQDEPLCCLIIMDSLKLHNKDDIANNILKWMNSEWKKRMNQQPKTKQLKNCEVEMSFNRSNVRIIYPKGR